MRYDTPVYLQYVIPGEYNAQTGNYEPDTITETKIYADVTSSGTETLKLIYGELRQDSLTIRLQNQFVTDNVRIRVGDKIYRIDFSRCLRTKQTLVVSVVQQRA